MTNKYVQNTSQKIKASSTTIPTKNEVLLGAPEGWARPTPQVAAVVSL